MIARSSFAGIDPGKTGALAILHPDNTVEFYDVPRVKLRNKDVPAYAEWQTLWSNAMALACVEFAVIEDVASRPGQGFEHVQIRPLLGFAHAIVLGIRPPAGRAVHDAGTVEGEARAPEFQQGASREKAVSLYPSVAGRLARVKDDGRAEALLIAHFGMLQERQ